MRIEYPRYLDPDSREVVTRGGKGKRIDVIIHIPKGIEEQLEAAFGRDLARAAREALAVEGYRSERLSLGQVAEFLGVSTDGSRSVPEGAPGAAFLYQVRKIRALLFHGLCRLGKIDWASESHQELDRCLSRTITASKNFND